MKKVFQTELCGGMMLHRVTIDFAALDPSKAFNSEICFSPTADAVKLRREFPAYVDWLRGVAQFFSDSTGVAFTIPASLGAGFAEQIRVAPSFGAEGLRRRSAAMAALREAARGH